jgi:hypothetical protein
MKNLFFLLSIILLAGCSTATVRQSDLDSWKGQSTTTLEQHPVFSTLPREEREIPDSKDRLINYAQKRMVETDNGSCFNTGFGFNRFGFGSTMCSPRMVEEMACTHQFLIHNNKVESYRVLGEDCSTECKFRPSPGDCKD